ncbi:MAG: PIG-L family deacetylase [Acidobacteria bacterium]|nr:PIG-L family deacetylase [Acidobacteriota bacterium]
MRRLLLAGLVIGAIALAGLTARDANVHAQSRQLSIVSADSGHVALGLAIRRLGVSGTFMQTAAHPDDEHNQLHALLARGMGLRSIIVQTTRGAGGQNEIGPELFQDMAVLRTAELLAAHRLDGAEQWFTRAIDYGYSFSPDEIYAKWGRREVVADFVRLIRTLRPDVVVTMNIQGRGGDRAHEATAVLTREAFRAAADPTQFPEQIAEGLRPWQAKKLYFSGAGGPPPGASVTPPAVRLASVNAGVYDQLLGRTYTEIGADARSSHKCQGMGQLSPLPGGGGGGRGAGPGRYQLVDSTIPGQTDKDETSLFDGIDTTLAGLAQYAGPIPPDALKNGLAAIADQARIARTAFDGGNDAAAAAPIVAGLSALRELRAQLASMGLSDTARYEIDLRLAIKEQDYQAAALAAYGVSFEALADDGLVVGGQPVKISLVAANRGASDITVADVMVTGFDGRAACNAGPVKINTAYTCTADVQIPKTARLTAPYWTDQYWTAQPQKAALDIYEPDVPFGAPFRPTPFRAVFRLKLGGADVTRDVPVQYRYARDVFVGEKRIELNVVPAFSVKMTPATAVVPTTSGAAAKPATREIHVSVTNGTKRAAQATVALEVPPGWQVAPAQAPLNFSAEDESLTVRFAVTVPAGIKPGDYKMQGLVTSAATGSDRFLSGYQEIDYPHIERRQVIKPAVTSLKVMNVRVAPNLRVGYIMGVGDQVPPALEQLGARLDFIEPDDLAWGDLSRYDVIMTGVRAYERRKDLRAYNRRLLDFAERGGTVIVQYNKMEFNQAQYGPFPARVSSARVTDENAPVTVLVPNHPVFTFPNTIGDRTWQGWVQERGLYFLGEKDAKYVDLVQMEDPFPDNPGIKRGALVEARTGKGRWLYVGLGLWREVPAGVEGAYQLLANLISLPRAPEKAGAPK